MRMFSRKKPDDLNEKERVKNLFHNKPSKLREIPGFRNSTPKICKLQSDKWLLICLSLFLHLLNLNKINQDLISFVEKVDVPLICVHSLNNCLINTMHLDFLATDK